MYVQDRHPYTHIHSHIYTHIYTHTYTLTHIHSHIYTHTYICTPRQPDVPPNATVTFELQLLEVYDPIDYSMATEDDTLAHV